MILQDLAIGLLVATLCSWLFGFTTGCPLVVTGLAGSVLPDFDMIIYMLDGGKLDKWAHRHRDYGGHWPLITVPAIGLFVWEYFGKEHAIALGAVVFLHYIADSGSTGWGIPWGYPFSSLYFCYRSVGDEPARFHAWTRTEQDAIAEIYGDATWTTKKQTWSRDLVFLGFASTITYIHFSFKC
ncbi:MAG: metal-dependent hydrolase [Candidatus Andersenbacteria bacterium]